MLLFDLRKSAFDLHKCVQCVHNWSNFPLQKPCTIRTCSTLDQNRSWPDQKTLKIDNILQRLVKTTSTQALAGVGQPKYCNNAYVHVVFTNLCSIFSIFEVETVNSYKTAKNLKIVNSLRWLKAVFGTFQDVVFDVSLLPLVVNCCHNHGIKKLPNH